MDARQVFLELVNRRGLQVRGSNVQCPCHEDGTPSLHFGVGRNGAILLKCHGCPATFEQILSALEPTSEERALLRGSSANGAGLDRGRQDEPIARYSYISCDGIRELRKLRFMPKRFEWERFEDGDWRRGLDGNKPAIYRAAEVHDAIARVETVFIAAGEKDADRLVSLGFQATTVPHGEDTGWKTPDLEQLAGVGQAIVFEDNDKAGRKYADTFARFATERGATVRVVAFREMAEHSDVSDWLASLPGTDQDKRRELVARCAAALTYSQPTDTPSPKSTERPVPWAAARSASEFLSTPEPEGDFLEDRILARGSLTLWNSPRGLGKTLAAHAICVKQARAGRRVLIVDRDNSRRELKRRLRGWGAEDLETLRVLGRDHAPPLTDRKAWEAFPIAEYDIVVIDSIDASTEGVGEQDSAKPSAALAAVLDVVHTAGGPSFLVLGNTTKSGAHGRGSGVIEDRADIVFEVRDATNFRPSGARDWWLELPLADRGSWGDRASRRKRCDLYRLAFIPSKFRIGEEPDPFALELKLTHPWESREVTDDIVRAGEAAVEQAAHEVATQLDTAAAALRTEVRRCTARGTPMKARDDAEPFLVDRGLSRKAARKLIADREGQDWRRLGSGKKNDPVVLVPPHTPRGDVSASIPRDESPHPERTSEPTIPADRMDQGPPESTCICLAMDAAARDPLIPADSALSTGVA